MTPIASATTRALAALALTLGAALVIPACSGDDDSGGSGGGATGLAFDEFGARIIPAICESQRTCLGSAAGAFGLDDCETQAAAQFNEAALPTLKASVDKGNTTYNGASAEACLAEIKTLGCALQTTRISDLTSCKGVLVGKTAAGGDCTDDSACAPGSYCKVEAACPGKCTAREAENGACTSDDDCQTGLTCDGVQGARKCVKPLAKGAACSSNTVGCEAGALCAGASAQDNKPGACKNFSDVFVGASGAACDLNAFTLCQTGLSCVFDGKSAFACAAKAASGAACTIAFPDQCPDGEFCDGIDTSVSPPKFDGTCKALPKAGEPCGKPVSGSGCASGLFCAADSKCKAPVKNEGACAEDRDCLSGHCVSGACVAEDSCNSK